jgi:hypothetical protein
MPATYDQINHEVVASAKQTVTFSNIPQIYTDLVLVAYGRQAASDSVVFRVGNGTVDSGNNYSATWGYGTSNRTSAPTPVHSSGRVTNTNLAVLVGWQAAAASTATYYGETQIFNYTSTSSFKSMLSHGIITDGVGGLLENSVISWRNNSAVNIIQIFNRNGNLSIGSSFSLYGIKAA